MTLYTSHYQSVYHKVQRELGSFVIPSYHYRLRGILLANDNHPVQFDILSEHSESKDACDYT